MSSSNSNNIKKTFNPNIQLVSRAMRYKARFVDNGRSQQFGVDCDDTFSPVVKSDTIRTFLSLPCLRIGLFISLMLRMHFLMATFLRLLLHTWLVSHQVVATRPCSYINKEFDMTDLGALNYFLGISVTRDSTGMFLSQKKYALELLERAHMANCTLTRASVDTESKLGSDGDPISDPTLYHSLAGSLVAYTDVDRAGFPTTRRSTYGYCVFLGDNLLSWSAKRKHTLSRSSAEAEYRGVANVVAKNSWLRNLLRELHTLLLSTTLVYCDNGSAIYMTANPVQHQRTKHIKIDIHFVRDMVAHGQVHVLYLPSRYQYADIFTKGLPFALFEKFRTSLSVQPSPAQTARDC
ncbi:ribonuclease H-like domain-containing protein [Tanacetum coccineum]